MKASRRLLLACAAAGALGTAWPALAQPRAQLQLVVVKVLSLGCSVCKASESQDSFIISALSARGGQFVHAPIPPGPRQISRELAYYAARAQGARQGAQVLDSLYRGAQEYGYPLADDVQVLDWLRFDLDDAIDHERMARELRSAPVMAALRRAVRLTVTAGAQALPTYVLLDGSDIVSTFDPTMTGPKPSLTVLRQQIVDAVSSYTKH